MADDITPDSAFSETVPERSLPVSALLLPSLANTTGGGSEPIGLEAAAEASYRLNQILSLQGRVFIVQGSKDANNVHAG